jgi:mono/diheme cytochrome c family protein
MIHFFVTISELFMRWSQRLVVGAFCAAVLTGCDSKPQVEVGRGETAASSVALRPFTGDSAVAQAGRVLFLQNNCYGCHGGLAGGGMGPSLRDTVWKFGGSDSAIYRSIHDGRPMGMPTWGNTLSPSDMKTLVVYIRSLRSSAEPKLFFWAANSDTATGARRP